METSPKTETAEQQTQVSAPNPPVLDPLLESAGKLADDPFWDEMMDSIRLHRREMDAAWNTSE